MEIALKNFDFKRVLLAFWQRVNIQVILWILKSLLLFAVIGSLILVIREYLDKSIVELLQVDSQNILEATTETETFPAKNEKVDYSLIASKNILGALSSARETQNNVSVAKPISTLPLELIGTFVTDKENSFAIIENKKKNEQDSFAIGDAVFGEAQLVSIAQDRVEIQRNGQTETLLIDQVKTKGPTAEGGFTNVGNDEYVVDEKELDAALENIPLLLSQARAIPYFKDGKSVGLRLFAIKPGSLFKKVGLENGDILKAINGQSLADPTQALKLFEQLKEERSITVALERNTQAREFKYQIR